jgi:NADPH-dependent 2,4-dienoyl-CoA reductase/sulfur reductase-like enzyme
MSSPHIIIIGGGVGGLALAQNFKKRGISFTLLPLLALKDTAFELPVEVRKPFVNAWIMNF